MPNENELREIARRAAFRITGVFEAPSYSSIQVVDRGIISYGQHQATLASGTLEVILRKYCDNCASESATELKTFLPRVTARDVALKTDRRFLDLLRKAGEEPEMCDAQDSIFIEQYWNPAVAKAMAEGIRSPLGFAIFYDTNVQGGLDNTIERVRRRLGSRSVSEQTYLKTFLECRRERLLEIAERQLRSAVSSTRTNGQMLRNAARNRIGALMKLVEAGNLDLVGRFDVNGKLVEGCTEIGGTNGFGTVTPVVLKRGDKNESVGALQDNLVLLGYMTIEEIGPHRGTFGPKTLRAVKAFQSQFGLPETGVFANDEQKLMNDVCRSVSRAKQNPAVTRRLQDRLVDLGYMTREEIGTAHGTFGPKTENAVKRFQTDAGLTASGEFDTKTFKALFNSAPPAASGLPGGKPRVSRRFSELRDPAGNHYHVTISSAGRVRVTEGFLVAGPHSPKRGITAILGDGSLKKVAGGSRVNLGIDYVVEEDPQRRVREWFGGRVFDVVHSSKGYGNRVIVKTGLTCQYKGKDYPVFTHYAHLDRTSVVKGQNIRAGDFVGVMGNTGGSHGAHVDQRFWIEVDGAKIDLSPNLLVVVEN